VHGVATAGIDTIKLHIDTGVNKRIIKVDRVFCLKKRRLALALCRQTGTKKPGTKNVLCSLGAAWTNRRKGSQALQHAVAL